MTQVIPLGSHDLFLAEVVAVDVDERLLDESGKLCLNKANLIVYSHGDYLALGRKLGSFGYSVRKKPRKKVNHWFYAASQMVCKHNTKPTRFLRGGMRVSRPTEHVIRSLHII